LAKPCRKLGEAGKSVREPIHCVNTGPLHRMRVTQPSYERLLALRHVSPPSVLSSARAPRCGYPELTLPAATIPPGSPPTKLQPVAPDGQPSPCAGPHCQAYGRASPPAQRYFRLGLSAAAAASFGLGLSAGVGSSGEMETALETVLSGLNMSRY